MNENYLVSIFIPVYNGEKYLSQTLQSVSQQTYKNIEVLLVDDSSTDDSLKICNDFASSDPRFKVFSKPNGGMTAFSWNFILPKVNGHFIFYLSQDDLLSWNLIESAVQRHLETNADCILPDLEFYFENEKGRKLEGVSGDRNVLLSGKEAFLKSLEWKIHGFGLNRISLYKGEVYPEDAFDSDEYMSRKVFLKSEKVAFCDGIFYYRQDNPDAITKNFSEKNFYRLNTYRRIYFLIRDFGLESKTALDYLFGLNYNFLTLKSTFRKFAFKSESEKNTIGVFLEDFRNELVKINQNISYKEKNEAVAFKLRILVLLVKYNFLSFIFGLYTSIKK
ncbi:glycosyltransferase family 2 protein [Flavobacterium amniphilum]|uniref:glycosyltransferase family 2 protein n=1 Tax=Flavobacterium amniphilum TaxID=1834035 RepID=UPI00202A22AD|nr:glycosyltransferase family 2 protein [Flavobacterium amniphilum]MCL9805624.1 glycosyltransferase family 2 protein [Flavobacterium amniphilum]